MGSRQPAIPSVPANFEPALRYILEAMRENLETMRGTRGDPRDRVATATELASALRRVQEAEAALVAATGGTRATATGILGGASRNDRSSFTGFVSSGGTTGAIDAAVGDDTGAFTALITGTGTLAATLAGDVGAFLGAVFSGSITGTIAATGGADFPAIFESQITGTLTKTLANDAAVLTGTVA